MIVIFLLQVLVSTNLGKFSKLVETTFLKSAYNQNQNRIELEMSSPNNVVRYYSKKIIVSTLLQESVAKIEICSKGKGKNVDLNYAKKILKCMH